MRPVINRILKILKKTLLILVIILGSLILTGTVFFMIYRDSIRQAVLYEVNRHLTAEVEAGKIHVSLLSHFPMLSVTMNDLRISGPAGLHGDADMLSTDELSLRFDIMDVLHGKYTMEAVQLSNARITLIVAEDGSDNFHFWKQPSSAESSPLSIEIRQVILRMVDISWQNLSSGESYSLRVINSKARGNVTEKNYELSVRGDFVANHIRRKDAVYLRDREVSADVQLKVTGRTFEILEGWVRSGLLSLHLAGRITAGEETETDLMLRTDEAPLAEYLNLLPPKYVSFTKDMAMEGSASASAMIRGTWNNNVTPEIRVDFQVNRGSLKFQHPDIVLDHIAATGSYSLTPAGRDEVRLERIRASLGEGWVEGSGRISDLAHPFVSLAVDAGLGLQDLAGLIPVDSLGEIAGRLNLKMTLKGPVDNVQKISRADLLGCTIQGDAQLSVDRLQLRKSSLTCRGIKGTFRFDNRLLTIEDLTGTSGTSDVQLRGVIRNYLPAILSGEEDIKVDMTLTSERLNLKELLSSGGTGRGNSRFSLPPNIRMNLDVALENLSYQDFLAQEVNTTLILRDRRLTLDDLSFRSMGGNVAADLDLSTPDGQPFQIKCNARLTHVDIQQLFHDFGNFDQKSLTDKHLRGWMDADVYYSSGLSPDLSIDVKSMYTLGRITVRSGELIGFTPLYKLSGILDIEDLKHIRFSELKNLIEIRNQTILIPEMEIKSNTLDLTLYGTHTFRNEVDYHISLLLSQLLARRVRPDRQKEFGVVMDDGLGRSTLFIAVKGTADDPRFTYDRPALKEKLASDLKKERRELKQALQDEFNIRRKTNEPVRVTPGERGDFVMEWEEATKDSIPEEKDQKKIRGPKFNLTWEEEDTLPEPRAD